MPEANISQQQNQQQTQGQKTQSQQAQGQQTQTADQQTQTTAPIKFDEWLSTQDEAIKTAYEQHVTGLRNTIKATRDERDKTAKEVKDLQTKAEKGSELEKSLAEIGSKLEAAERRIAFFEDAVKPGIDCRNPKAAFALAVAENLFDRKGSPDWATLKTEAPELFGKVITTANAGDGSGSKLKDSDMNQMIRRAAGRG